MAFPAGQIMGPGIEAFVSGHEILQAVGHALRRALTVRR
jgi:hypothetical protein